LPLLYIYVVKAYRARLTESNTIEVLGSLYAIYKPKHYYWESVVISRRLLIAIIIALTPFNSPLLYFGFFVVIHGYSIAHVIHKPFARKEDNILDFTSQVVLLMSLFVGLLIGVDVLQDYEIGFSLFLLVLNLSFLVFGGSLIARHFGGKAAKWWNEKGKGRFTRSKKPDYILIE